MVRNIRLDHLSVCLSACLSVGQTAVYCGKTAEQIQMPIGAVSGVHQGMGVLDWGS